MHELSAEQFKMLVAGFLGPYYLVLACINAVAAFLAWKKGKNVNAFLWIAFSFFFVLIGAMAGSGIFEIGGYAVTMLSEDMKGFVDWFATPVKYTLVTSIGLTVLFVFRRFFVQPVVAFSMMNIAFLLLGLSMPDKDFYAIIAKPDNVPIVMLLFFVAFFTWIGAYRAVQNDERKKLGLGPLEAEPDEQQKILVWPDLVYSELICMIALTAFLIFWAIALQAPLEEPANYVKTPNPSKAPWYFLGLQEMLVYYDPWMAGVVLPNVLVVGLMAIPYLDFNKAGNGYYTIEERKFSYIVFQIGFLEMWITLIVLGTLLRGPNWNFFGPFQEWNAHKVESLNNINLSEIIWQDWLGRSLPKAPSGSSGWLEFGYIMVRECVGIAALVFYFLIMPALLVVTVLRNFYKKMGLVRVMILANLLLLMASLPAKMLLRWVWNLKYVVAIPEYFLNF